MTAFMKSRRSASPCPYAAKRLYVSIKSCVSGVVGLVDCLRGWDLLNVNL